MGGQAKNCEISLPPFRHEWMFDRRVATLNCTPTGLKRYPLLVLRAYECPFRRHLLEHPLDCISTRTHLLVKLQHARGKRSECLRGVQESSGGYSFRMLGLRTTDTDRRTGSSCAGLTSTIRRTRSTSARYASPSSGAKRSTTIPSGVTTPCLLYTSPSPRD